MKLNTAEMGIVLEALIEHKSLVENFITAAEEDGDGDEVDSVRGDLVATNELIEKIRVALRRAA